MRGLGLLLYSQYAGVKPVGMRSHHIWRDRPGYDRCGSVCDYRPTVAYRPHTSIHYGVLGDWLIAQQNERVVP